MLQFLMDEHVPWCELDWAGTLPAVWEFWSLWSHLFSGSEDGLDQVYPPVLIATLDTPKVGACLTHPEHRENRLGENSVSSSSIFIFLIPFLGRF